MRKIEVITMFNAITHLKYARLKRRGYPRQYTAFLAYTQGKSDVRGQSLDSSRKRPHGVYFTEVS